MFTTYKKTACSITRNGMVAKFYRVCYNQSIKKGRGGAAERLTDTEEEM